MKAFTNSKSSTGRSTTSCGYCRTQGHSIKDCPYIKHDHDEWAAFRVPHKSPTLQTPLGRWIMRDYSYWNKQIAKFYPKWERWQQPTNGSSRAVSTSPRLCGFCRGEGHTRRDCPEMAKIYANLLEANKNYRKALYDTLVSRLGLGIGAVIKVQTEQGYYSNRTHKEHIGTVMSFDLTSPNLFQMVDSYSLDRDYRGDVTIEVLVDGETKNLNLRDFAVTSPSGDSHTAFRRGHRWNTVDFVETIAPSQQPLDQEWVERDADAFEWLLKKRTKEWLEERSMLSIINQWKGRTPVVYKGQ